MGKKNIFVKKEYLLSFLLPVLFVLTAFAVSGIYPFGSRLMSASDFKEQYIDLIYIFFDKIKKGGNIFLLNQSRMGINLYSWAVYFLFSPFNYLLFFADKYNITQMLELVYILKVGTVGLSAFLFFTKSRITGQSAKINLPLSVLYALNMFCITTSINIFWTDMLILLPICFLGIEALAEKNDMRLFFGAYLLCVLNSYYLAYISGIICFLYFIYVCAALNKKSLVGPFLLLLLSALAAAVLSAVTLLPVAQMLFGNFYGKVLADSGGELIRFDAAQILRGLLFIEDASPVIKSTLHIFFGIMPVYLTVAFILSRDINKKERIAVFCILLFFVLTLTIRRLYVIMHCMGEPAAFECRYSYAMALIFDVFAARALLCREKISKFARAAAAMLIMAFAAAALLRGISAYYIKFVLWIALVLTVYYFTAFGSKRPQIYIFALCVLAEALVSSTTGFYMIKKHLGYEENGRANAYINKTESLLEHIDEGEYYRICDLYMPSRMINLRTGYNAMDAFCSVINKRGIDLAGHMGMHAVSDNKYLSCADNGIVSDSIFNIKYLLASDSTSLVKDNLGREIYLPNGARLTSDNYEKIYGDENAAIYKNSSAFPLMFAADEGVMGCNDGFYGVDVISGYFLNQETLINAILAENNKLYDIYYDIGEPYAYNCGIEKLNDVTYKIVPGGNWTPQDGGTAAYRFTVEEPGEYYVNFFMLNKTLEESFGSYILSVNGMRIDHEYLKNNFAKDIGSFKKGDTIDIGITSYTGDTEFAEPCILRLDTEKFKGLAKKIQANGLKNIRTENDDILAESDFADKKFIFTTIAYDKGYRVYIDGQKTEKIAAADAMLGFYVPAGRHSIKITYVSEGFVTGLYISVFFAAALIGFCAVKLPKKHNR